MKFQILLTLVVMAPGACKTSERVAPVRATDIRAEIIVENCLPANAPGEVRVKISNRGERDLKINPGYFYLNDVLDEKNESVPSPIIFCPLLSTLPDWYEVKKDSTVLLPLQITGLHRFLLQHDQAYTLEMACYLGDGQGRSGKRSMPAEVVLIRSGTFSICR